MSRRRGVVWSAFAGLVALTAALCPLAACPQARDAIFSCSTGEGKKIAERAGTELSALWGKDAAEWRARALELAAQHGRSFLYCVADLLEKKGVVGDGHSGALRALAQQFSTDA